MFLKNIPILMEKGVGVTRLFSSQIFCFTFDFDEWPSTHTDADSYMRPYNDSIFSLRTSYTSVFPEKRLHLDPDMEDGLDSSKFYKVSYTLNMLPQIGEYVVREADGSKTFVNKGQSLLEMANEADELEIFEAANFQDVIAFKWDTFAYMIHLRGCLLHLYYVFILIIYVDKVYIQNDLESKRVYSLILITGIIYPTCYELFQQYKIGPKKYFSELGNYSDILYTWGGIANVILQNSIDSQHIANKILMTLLLSQQIVKTFFFLRIFETLSYIVTMINQVVFDLRVFILFYSILIVIFSMIFAVLGVGNKKFGGFKAEFAPEI